MTSPTLSANAIRWQNATSSRRSQGGVGILEVLIALVVISLGVLGMAGLQLTGLKHSTNGFNRTKAVMIADEMATRMWINRTGILDGSYDNFDSQDLNCAVRPTTFCQPFGINEAQRCDSDELATFDKFIVACGDWGAGGARGGVVDLLPNDARLQVSCDEPCSEGSSYTVTVTWPERSNASSETTDRTSRVQKILRP